MTHARFGSFDASDNLRPDTPGESPGTPGDSKDNPSNALRAARAKEVLAWSDNTLPSSSAAVDADGQGADNVGPITLKNTWSALVGSAPADVMKMVRSVWSKEETVTAYTALFRTRRAATAVAQMPSLLAADVLIRTCPAPQYLDAEWSSLLTPRRTRTFVAGLAWSVAVVLFLLWNVPVGLVQGLVRLDTISEVLEEIGLPELVDIVDSITGTRRATVEGWVSEGGWARGVGKGERGRD